MVSRIFVTFFVYVFIGCGSAQIGSKTNPAPDKNIKARANVRTENLPDRISCLRSSYKLVLILKDPQLSEGITAIGLKDGNSVVFKVATQIYTYTDQPNSLSFMEIPATSGSKLVVLDLQTKVAKVSNFKISDLEDGSEFTCIF